MNTHVYRSECCQQSVQEKHSYLADTSGDTVTLNHQKQLQTAFSKWHVPSIPWDMMPYMTWCKATFYTEAQNLDRYRLITIEPQVICSLDTILSFQYNRKNIHNVIKVLDKNVTFSVNVYHLVQTLRTYTHKTTETYWSKNTDEVVKDGLKKNWTSCE